MAAMERTYEAVDERNGGEEGKINHDVEVKKWLLS